MVGCGGERGGHPLRGRCRAPIEPAVAKRTHDPHRLAQQETKEADKAAILAAEDLGDDEANEIASRGPQSVREVAQLARHRVHKH